MKEVRSVEIEYDVLSTNVQTMSFILTYLSAYLCLENFT